MRSTCISADPRSLADHQQHRAVKYSGLYDITPGREYEFVGMAIAERTISFLTKDDMGEPAMVPAGLFALFDAKIPDHWRFRLSPGIQASGRDLWTNPVVAVWGFAELVDQPDFTARLMEFETDAMRVFESQFEKSTD